MWDYVAQFTEFSPDYLGNGYQFVITVDNTRSVTVDNSYMFDIDYK